MLAQEHLHSLVRPHQICITFRLSFLFAWCSLRCACKVLSDRFASGKRLMIANDVILLHNEVSRPKRSPCVHLQCATAERAKTQCREASGR